MRHYIISDKLGKYRKNISASSHDELVEIVQHLDDIPSTLIFVKVSERLGSGDLLTRADGTSEEIDGAVLYKRNCSININGNTSVNPNLDLDGTGI